MLLLRKPRKKQPRSVTRRNLASLLASRLVWGLNLASRSDVFGRPLTGPIALIGTREGLAFDGTSSGYVVAPSQNGLVGGSTGGSISTHHHTIVIIGYDIGNGFIYDPSGGTPLAIEIVSGNLRYYPTGSNNCFAGSPPAIPTSGRVCIGVYVGQYLGNQPECWVNGTVYTGVNTNQDSWIAPAYTTFFGSSLYPGPNKFTGKGVAAYVFKGKLSAEEMQFLDDAHLELFRAETGLFPEGGGGGTAIDVGRANETDAALALAPLQMRTVGLATEANAALALAQVQPRTVGLATQTDTALALSSLQLRATGVATEAGTALALAAVQIRAVGMATEADTALALDAAGSTSVGLATEVDTAYALPVVQIRSVGMAVESSTALALTPLQILAPGLALEIDTAFALPLLQIRQVGRADEVDTAYALGDGPVEDPTFTAESRLRLGADRSGAFAGGLGRDRARAFAGRIG